MNELKREVESVVKAMKLLTEKAEILLERIESIEEKNDDDKTLIVFNTTIPDHKSTKSLRASAAQKITAKDKVYAVIKRSRKGVNTAHLKTKTGFDDKKIQNIIYKLKKQGMIKNLRTGVYVKA